mgnify:FL=1
MSRFVCVLVFHALLTALAGAADTFPSIDGQSAPSNLREMWGDFDPRAEPLEVETLATWEEDEVVLRVVRFRIGVFKGQPALLAAVYGFPKGAKDLPGLVQVHGGGQYADANACIANARRGYATVSIAWAGRISSSNYRVNPEGVKLFWENATSNPHYRLTTDWGAVDGYHAPGRHQGNQFPSAKPHPWTLDSVESPRNSGWFLCATAARRALTFLEQQPEVDKSKLGVYGHSMGGKLTVLTATDSRVKAAAPSCGGISDRYNNSQLFRDTLGDSESLKEITCPIIFLSPANDFHGRLGDLPKAIGEIRSEQWRVTCSPQHSHQDTAPFEVATLLWFDDHLKNSFQMPDSPTAILRLQSGEAPSLEVTIDESKPIRSVDVFYTQHGRQDETPSDREFTTNRFWHHVKPTLVDGRWLAQLPISSTDKPIWAYANVSYALEEPVSGAGYYYRTYTADSFNLSSLVSVAWADEVASSRVVATQERTTMIETFVGDWQKEWFTYRPFEWARTTHKLHDEMYRAPAGAKLALDVRSLAPNELVVLIDDYAAVASLDGGNEFEHLTFAPDDFQNHAGESLIDWNSAKRFRLSPAEHLKPTRQDPGKPRLVGRNWRGAPPTFRNLRWKIPE